jgi:hypothetical protein
MKTRLHRLLRLLILITVASAIRRSLIAHSGLARGRLIGRTATVSRTIRRRAPGELELVGRFGVRHYPARLWPAGPKKLPTDSEVLIVGQLGDMLIVEAASDVIHEPSGW